MQSGYQMCKHVSDQNIDRINLKASLGGSEVLASKARAIQQGHVDGSNNAIRMPDVQAGV